MEGGGRGGVVILGRQVRILLLVVVVVVLVWPTRARRAGREKNKTNERRLQQKRAIITVRDSPTKAIKLFSVKVLGMMF